MRHLLVSALFLMAAGQAMAGGSMDIGLTNSSLRFEHDATRVGTGAHITAGLLYNDTEGYAISGSFNAVDASGGRPDMVGGLGFKAFLYRHDDAESAVSVAVGGFVRYNPDSWNGMGVDGIFYFSPDVLSFNKTGFFYESAVRLTYKVMPQARVFVGYQDISVEYDDIGSRSIDKGFNLGFRVNY
jgi:hypothetical protein